MANLPTACLSSLNSIINVGLPLLAVIYHLTGLIISMMVLFFSITVAFQLSIQFFGLSWLKMSGTASEYFIFYRVLETLFRDGKLLYLILHNWVIVEFLRLFGVDGESGDWKRCCRGIQ